MKDYYKILEVSEDADEDKIKKSYRKLAHQYHPDKKGGDEEKFKNISEAYSVLSNKEERKKYDFSRKYGEGERGSDFNFSFFNSQHFSSSMAEEFISQIMRKRAIEKYNIRIFYPLTIKELFEGKKEKIKINRKILDKENNEIDQEIEIDIDIPKGGFFGREYKISKKGHQIPNTKDSFGDVFLNIKIFKHEIYQLANNGNIYIELNVPLNIALLGGEIEVPTLHGIRKIKIPAKTKNGHRVVLSNLGFILPDRKNYGDQIVDLVVEFPDTMTEDFRKCLTQMNLDDKYFPQYSSMLTKAKEESKLFKK